VCGLEGCWGAVGNIGDSYRGAGEQVERGTAEARSTNGTMPYTPAESLWKGCAACVAYSRVSGLEGSCPMSLMCPTMCPFLLLLLALPQ
jgi:hypothetical protein